MSAASETTGVSRALSRRTLAGMMVRFVPATVRIARLATSQMAVAGCRGDVATIALWRARGEEWKNVVARVKALRLDESDAGKAALTIELSRAMAMIERWEAT